MRAGQYNRDPNFFDLDFKVEFRTDDYSTQRGLEQKLFNDYQQPPMNVYRPIYPRNPNGPDYMNSALNFLHKLFGGD